MFDQPELEAMLRTQPQDIPPRPVSGRCRGHRRHPDPADRVKVSFLDRVRGGEHSVQASYVLGCDGANSAVRAGIGAHMYGLPFQQTWLVIDVDTDAELNQWGRLPPTVQVPSAPAPTCGSAPPATGGNSGCSTGKPPPTTNHRRD